MNARIENHHPHGMVFASETLTHNRRIGMHAICFSLLDPLPRKGPLTLLSLLLVAWSIISMVRFHLNHRSAQHIRKIARAPL